MTIMELMNEYDQNCEGMMEATEQSVYVSLVLIWNRLRRPEWFDVSRLELMRKAGIRGKNRLDRARKGLEEKGFITSESTGRTSPRKYHLEPLPARPETGLETRSKMDLEKKLGPKQTEHWVQNGPKLGPKWTPSQREYTEKEREISLSRVSN